MSSFYTSSPTLVMAPQPNQYFGQPHMRHFNRPVPSPKSMASSQRPLAGRKRSRDDDDDEQLTLAASVQQPPIDRGEPIYGPGMTLIYPNDPSGAYSMDSCSQSGTWVETRAETAAKQAQRPNVSSRKSQRLASSAPGPDDIALHAQPELRRTTSTEPLIDEVTCLLGISWMRMDATEALCISQKAYTKWVQRHYPGLTDVQLWFENSSIPGYLGVATNKASGTKEFLLWSYDLKQAVLVTKEQSELIAKLMSPQAILSSATTSIFASDEPVVGTLDNGRSPSPSFTLPSAAPPVAAMDVD